MFVQLIYIKYPSSVQSSKIGEGIIHIWGYIVLIFKGDYKWKLFGNKEVIKNLDCNRVNMAQMEFLEEMDDQVQMAILDRKVKMF